MSISELTLKTKMMSRFVGSRFSLEVVVAVNGATS